MRKWSGTMKQSNRIIAASKAPVVMAVCSLFFSTIPYAQAAGSEEPEQAQGPEQSSPFAITKRSQFGCAEVDDVKAGGLASHEITLDPRKVERCLFKKVGSRFHDCKKLKIESATADWYGVVTLDTDEGPVKFWFEEHGSTASEEAKKVMVWTWPDSEKKFVCAAYTSRR